MKASFVFRFISIPHSIKTALFLSITSLMISPLSWSESEEAALETEQVEVTDQQAEVVETKATIESLRALVDKGAYKDAYAQGQDMLFDYEGEPEFDLLYGTAASEVGETKEAIFIFERLAENDPANIRYQLELGKAYYQQGERDKARDIFERVLASDQELPPNVEARILAYLDAINSGSNFGDPAKAETLKGFVGIAFGSDSNANGATDSGTINRYIGVSGTPGYTISTPNGTKEESTTYISHQIALAYVKPLTEKTALDFKVFGSNRKNMDDDLRNLDSGSVYFEIGNRWKIGEGLAYFSLRQTGVKLGHDDLYDYFNIGISWAQPLEWQYADSMSINFTTGTIRYSDDANDSRDIDPTTFDIGFSKQVNQLIHSVGIQYGMDSSQGYLKNFTGNDGITHAKVATDYLSRDYYGLSYSLAYLYSTKTVFQGGVFYQSSSYDAVDLEFTNLTGPSTAEFAKRDGDMIVLTLGARYNWNKSLHFRANATSMDVTSDIDSFEYSRNKLEVGAGYQL